MGHLVVLLRIARFRLVLYGRLRTRCCFRIHLSDSSYCLLNRHSHCLTQAITVANLELTLQNEGPFTVFAPSDEAFAKAGIDLSTYESDEDIAALSDTLLYHVIAEFNILLDLAEGDNVVTAANGDELTVTLANGAVTVGAQGASVTIADVLASNGSFT